MIGSCLFSTDLTHCCHSVIWHPAFRPTHICTFLLSVCCTAQDISWTVFLVLRLCSTESCLSLILVNIFFLFGVIRARILLPFSMQWLIATGWSLKFEPCAFFVIQGLPQQIFKKDLWHSFRNYTCMPSCDWTHQRIALCFWLLYENSSNVSSMFLCLLQ